MRAPALALLAGLGCLGAQEGPAESLRRLEALAVRTAPGPFQPLSDSPAITTVITQEEIHTAGYASVAEALAAVPGFYGISDFLGENVGVRGVNAGPRAYSRILKVMIDRQPVAFRSDSTCFLGPELIPMEAVDRIEITRGPASALYGADAFLGAINIVTRAYARRTRASLLARAGWLGGRPESGGEGVAESGGGAWSLLVAASHQEQDRSGLRVPDSSPVLRVRPPADPESHRDFAHPTSLLLKAAYLGQEGLSTELTGHLSRTSSEAQWADFSPLSEANKVVLSNGFLRLRTVYRPSEHLELSAFAAQARGGPEAGERLASSSSNLLLRRDMDYRSLDAGAEGTYLFRQRDALTLGLDWTRDDQRLMRILQIDQTTGEESPATLDPGRMAFTNLGAYLQLLTHGGEDLDLTINLRRDRQNFYGSTTSHRLGLVYRLGDALYAKLLHGTAFKAPSPYQLYGQPLYFMEFQGNPRLGTERAETTELEFGWEPGTDLLAKLNAYYNRVQGMIVLIPRGVFVPENSGRRKSYGLEGELRAAWGRHLLRLGGAYERTRELSPTPFQGDRDTPSSAYPPLSASLRWEYRAGERGTLEAGARYASRRRASLANLQANYYTPYSLPSYTVCHLAYALPFNGVRLHLRVDNLFNTHWAEPGYRGFDIPSPPREIALSAAWNF